MKYLLRAIVLLAALGLLLGCGSDKKTSSPATTTTLSNVTPSSTTTTRRNLRDDYTTSTAYLDLDLELQDRQQLDHLL